ncbi:MAG: hypothetical protein ACR2JB_10540 [Bryobacteraceae bacterium]
MAALNKQCLETTVAPIQTGHRMEKSLLFGRFPADESPEAGTLNLEILDLRTHAISKVPRPEGL